jgi:hypothetical protein
VTIDAVDPEPGRNCIAVAEEQSTEVRLAEPVGDRTLLDERGEELRVRR